MALTNKLSAIGDAIREKTGKTELLTLDAMPAEIAAIQTGGGELPEEALVITGDCMYRFSRNGWNWFIENYGNQITTKDINSINSMFQNSSKLTSIPFDINLFKITQATAAYELNYIFQGCSALTELPKMNNVKPKTMKSMFSNCNNLTSIPEDYFDDWDMSYITTTTSTSDGAMDNMFMSCYKLRKIPRFLFTQDHINRRCSGSISIYSSGISYCYNLEEFKLPVYDLANLTSNAFGAYGLTTLSRIKSITFNTNEDGSPIVCSKWSKQSLKISNYIGYSYSNDTRKCLINTLGEDKCYTDDESYARLKDDPDGWTTEKAYSRYNHDSAVETINSLPDVSAGSGNTITFEGAAGSKTDGGAINTLTEEEIAVAAAKGWTVSFV